MEEGACLEPGSVVPPGRRVPAATIWGGNPCKYIKDVDNWEVRPSTPCAICGSLGGLPRYHPCECCLFQNVSSLKTEDVGSLVETTRILHLLQPVLGVLGA